MNNPFLRAGVFLLTMLVIFAIVAAAMLVGMRGAYGAPAEGCRQWTWSIPVDVLGPDAPEIHGCVEAPWGTKRQSWINDTGRCAWHARKAVRLGATTYAQVTTRVEAQGCTFQTGEGWIPVEFSHAN
jgi:hypothetical protein